VELEASEKEMATMKPLLVVIPVTLVLVVLMSVFIPYMASAVVLFACLLVLASASVLYPYLGARKRLKRARAEMSTQTAVEPPETVVQVLRMLRGEYAYPLRLLTVRTHDELMYTGRVYLTTTGVRFKEAVFIPTTHH
jgi:hypothetical protein